MANLGQAPSFEGDQDLLDRLCKGALLSALQRLSEQVDRSAMARDLVLLTREARRPKLDEVEVRLRAAEEKVERLSAQVVALSNTLQFRLPTRRVAIQRAEPSSAAAQ